MTRNRTFKAAALAAACFLIRPADAAQSVGLSGQWLLHDRKVLSGTDYANGVPDRIAVNETPEAITIERQAVGASNTEKTTTESLKFDSTPVETLSNPQLRKTAAVTRASDGRGLTETASFRPVDATQNVTSTSTEFWTLSGDGSELRVVRTMKSATGDPADGKANWSMEGIYRRDEAIAGGGTQGIRFVQPAGWSETLAEAKAQNKVIFVDCFATWCGPCKQMDRMVYVQKDVGDFFNARFLPVRVQMDRTPRDDERVRGWYADAAEIGKKYGVTALPAFLFVSPDGTLLHRGVGMMWPDTFIQLGKDALDPSRQEYAALHAYLEGRMDCANLGRLALELQRDTSGTLDERKERARLTRRVAADYKVHCLDELDASTLFSRENLDFIWHFPEVVDSHDRFFDLFFHRPAEAETLFKRSGFPALAGPNIARGAVTREELDEKLWRDGKPASAAPDWDGLYAEIARKYGKGMADDLVLDYRIGYDQRLGDWREYARLMDERNQERGSTPGSGLSSDSWRLNINAWNTFLHCGDRAVLEAALRWSEASLRLVPQKDDLQYLDTKANLLYKLGRKDEAIATEREAVRQDEDQAKARGQAKGFFTDEYNKTIERMEKGEPTWPPAVQPSIDNAAADHWPHVGRACVSDDGRFVLYDVEEGLSAVGNFEVVLQACDGGSARHFPDVQPRFWTFLSHWALMIAKPDTLRIVELNTGAAEEVPGVASYKVPDDPTAPWVAYQTNAATKDLVLRNLAGGVPLRLGAADSYAFNATGRKLVFTAPLGEGNRAVHWVDLETGRDTKIWEGALVGGVAFDAAGAQAAFLSREAGNGNPNPVLWRYAAGTDRAESRVDSGTTGMDPGAAIAPGSVKFSDDGSIILFDLASAAAAKPKPGAVSMDVWSYRDARLQSQQLIGPIDPFEYRLFGPHPRHRAVSVSGQPVIARLSEENEDLYQTQGDYALVENRPGDFFEHNWNPAARGTEYLVSLRDGSRRLLAEGLELHGNSAFALSPTGKILLEWDLPSRSFRSFDIAAGQWRAMPGTERIDWGQPGERVEDLNYYAPWRAGWLEKEGAVLVCDAFDVWKLDLAGEKPPVNVTRGLGRARNVVFHILFRNSPKVSLINQEMAPEPGGGYLLYAFDRVTKARGFYALADLSGAEAPRQLAMGPYGYRRGRDVSGNEFAPDVERAMVAHVYVVSRETAEESTNWFWTPDFIDFHRLSDVHPERNYNWMTDELIQWTGLDGTADAGVLYKPENFDPSRKYPMVIHIYEKESNNLNKYVQPEHEGTELNDAWLVSNGYVVLRPDIHFRIGEPGPSARDSIVAAVKYLATKPWVDPRRIGVEGGSFGGYEVDYLVTHSDVFAAAFSRDGTSEQVMSYLSGGSGNRSALTTPYPMYWAELQQGSIGKTLWQAPELYIKDSPVFGADTATTPLLLMGNKADTIVPVDQEMAMFNSLRRMGKKVWMLQYDGEGHVVIDPKAALDLDIRIEQFFDHYLKGAPAPKWMTEGIPARLKGIDDGLQLDTSGKEP